MKNYLIALSALIVVSCGVNTEEYNKVVAQRDSLITVVSQMESVIDELKNGEGRIVGLIENLISSKDYIGALSKIELLRTKHPESMKVIEYDSKMSSLKAKAKVQQDAIDKHVRDSIRMANLGNLGIWKINYFVDDFGEPTDEGYITTEQPIYGTFSNTATQDSRLRVRFIIAGKKSVAIKLFEYDGNNPVKGYEDSYKVLVQDKDGNRYELYASNYDSDRLTFSSYGSNSDSEKFHKILMKGGNVKVRIIDRDRTSTQYNFTVNNADWYENAYYKLTGDYPKE